ncbi:MAG: hypothetical protein A3B74_04120 [Candidatus Kerfeldbacteria bacterium RIFCSPHIGHO2_02_FULL_42_14]|uniref:Tyr recombinase domain-containing protein n=1 Tax=Candidatus Kerfeldbacteria bacterium RIFCSPHIGHO2_02_FULL_42_14 TaxID=1798540 RepID=A0A1G2AQ80_9BACT|nr:MAG: hypothetical protein A3B74_04120 [Candidatus Kerfeldbacteria bacterium RIFCSPHIGHO2_02_FULL_42_14]OGY80694.1 MAG: hypothetical protein A3E60_04615 [Candidatus Kerfeldbacteria bacterium RIFCSPHIGHO2_12_FULL_42_13]OGY82621.1 MAG: hypothetical protein A3I91_04280 [Candidatus Kerfeldbacteria bacterium RIFCSPLOWO2_02_FULL_42_19]OGY85224.1 MAG: hypothetical protein A3G01_01410 [Candidatus Kerfeldbacteria bacterium RIFCSPLOWO2_12_FULL_43_9]
MPSLLEILKREIQVRNYSYRTYSAYSRALWNLYTFFRMRINKIGEDEMKFFIQDQLQKGRSSQTIALYIHAINFARINLYHLPPLTHIHYPKRAWKLPVILTRDEIRRMIACTANLKHRVLLALTYGSGLRVSEVVRLRMSDIDLNNLLLFIRNGKGNKDRLTVISKNFIQDLRTLITSQ